MYRNIALRAGLQRLIGTCKTRDEPRTKRSQEGPLSILVKNLNFEVKAVVVFLYLLCMCSMCETCILF